jgi:death on curing protein
LTNIATSSSASQSKSVAWHYLDLVDYLLIAEKVLGLPAETLARLDRIDLADSALHAPQAGFGGVEAYPEFDLKAAVLLWHLTRNHPLPDGNKRAAFLSTVEFVRRNGFEWRRSPEDPADTDAIIRGVAAGKTTQAELRTWIARRLAGPEDGE